MFITNQDKRCYKLSQLHYYKLGQVLLEIGAAITKYGNRYYKIGQLLQIWAKFIVNCVTNCYKLVTINCYKLGQLHIFLSNLVAKAPGLNLGGKIRNLLGNQEALNQQATFCIFFPLPKETSCNAMTLFYTNGKQYSKKRFLVTATEFEPTTTKFENELSNIQPNRPVWLNG